eukprot:SAG22_NODE_2297_length_2744_cov_4.528544_2_plen_525_part_00
MLYYRPPGVDVWEVGFTFCFPVMRALVVAAKYGYYTDAECAADTGIGGKNYEVEDRMNKKLASNWVCNLHDQLYSVIVEELYETSVRVDCDLSQALFDVGAPAAVAVWAEAKATLATALEQASKTGPGFASEKVERQKWGHYQDLQLKVFGPAAVVEATVQKGQLPASLMAWKCACDCYYVDPCSGRRRFFGLLLTSLAMSSIAPVCRLLLAFGGTGPEKAVLGLGMWGSGAGFFLMLLYVVAPRWDHASRYRAAQFMCDLMGDGVSVKAASPSAPAAEADEAEDAMASGDAGRAEAARRPRDASSSWQGAPAEVRLLLDPTAAGSVACAGEFGHSFYLRFQVYSFLLFGGSCAFVGAMTFTSKSGGTMDTVAFVHVMSRVVALVCAVLMQVASGYMFEPTHRVPGEATVLSFKGSDHCLSFCFSAFPCGSAALTSDTCCKQHEPHGPRDEEPAGAGEDLDPEPALGPAGREPVAGGARAHGPVLRAAGLGRHGPVLRAAGLGRTSPASCWTPSCWTRSCWTRK